MYIEKIAITDDVKIKVYEKHFVRIEEIKDVLLDDEPRFKRVGGNQYAAIGKKERHLTIFFKYDEKMKIAEITTAYPSDRKQMKHYKSLLRR